MNTKKYDSFTMVGIILGISCTIHLTLRAVVQRALAGGAKVTRDVRLRHNANDLHIPSSPTHNVIRGHVIPRTILFTRLVSFDSYPSEAYGDDIKVELTIINESNAMGNSYSLYAQSNTIHSDYRHKRGLEFLDLVNYAPDFKDILTSSQEKTLFAPSNEAIRQLPAESVALIKTNITAITNVSIIDCLLNLFHGPKTNTATKTNRNGKGGCIDFCLPKFVFVVAAREPFIIGSAFTRRIEMEIYVHKSEKECVWAVSIFHRIVIAFIDVLSIRVSARFVVNWAFHLLGFILTSFLRGPISFHMKGWVAEGV
ncbi:fasciclin-1 [Trichonephila clavipes]|nr:fasciclin-1 [Trichonephila clavipes]